ncbi:MAG: twin-arginine translocase subunit TatC [Dermatophilaceae bacterium]
MRLPRLRRQRDPEGRMSLGDHLRELRRRTVICVLGVLAGAVLGWTRFDELYAALTKPVADLASQRNGATALVVFSTLTDSFSIRIAVSLFVGLILASPLWVYQTWAFIVPGLTRTEKRTAIAFLAAAIPLFLAGCVMAYLVVPRAVQTLLGFTPESGSNILPIAGYLSFILKFILAFGIAFLLPVFMVGLNAVGALPAATMLKGWRVAVFLIFVFTAVMTPTPDPWMMILMALPMIALFFGAVGIAALTDRRRAKRAAGLPWATLEDGQASAL